MDLNDLRQEIDAIDEEMLQLFMKRMKISGRVGQYKAQNGIPVTDRTREREILSVMGTRAGDMGEYAYCFFSNIMDLSKSYQGRIISRPGEVRKIIEKALERSAEAFPKTGSVACCGSGMSSTKEACDKMLPQGEIISAKTFKAVFDAVDSGSCRFGILPIGYSTKGNVNEIYELLMERKCYIVRSTVLYAHHELTAGACGNTSSAPTRFICITKDPVIYEGADHISLMVSCDNRPGALNDILSKITAHGVNISMLESCPLSGDHPGPVFFLELEASVEDAGIIEMLEDIERSCRTFDAAGSYAIV